MKKWKVWVQTYNDPKYYTNAMEYDTMKEAEEAGLDLASRWFAVENWEVREKVK